MLRILSIFLIVVGAVIAFVPKMIRLRGALNPTKLDSDSGEEPRV